LPAIPLPIDVSLTANISTDWQVWPDHQHVVVEAGATGFLSFRLLRDIPLQSDVPVNDHWSDFQMPSLRLEADLLEKNVRLRVPGKDLPVSLT
jgi:hypothetical protein